MRSLKFTLLAALLVACAACTTPGKKVSSASPYDTGCAFAPTLKTCPMGSFDSGDGGQ